MSVHNGAPWVRDAVASVLAQTAGDLELIVIDDGSTDASPELLAAVRDSRVRTERREHAGLTRALNRALAMARAPLVARLDADDLALPERLARQRAFLGSHPDVGLLGTGARARDAERLGAEARVRWRAVRSGAYPWWCALFAARPVLALALPGAWRRALRRTRGGSDHL